MSSSRRARLVGVALVVVTLALYARVVGHDFIFSDDDLYVTNNPHVLGGLSWSNVRWAMSSLEVSNWHPLTWISHMADVTLFGPRAGAVVMVNATLHAISAALLFAALLRMTGAIWPSVLVAALFAWHPLHVQSVAWVSERKDVLSGLLLHLLLLIYAGYALKPTGAKYAMIVAIYCLGLMAKPMLVTLPLVLILLDIWPLKRAITRRVLLEKAPLLLLSAGACVVTFVAQRAGGSTISIERIGLVDRVCNALVAYALYLFKTVWPSALLPYYPHPVYRPVGQVVLAAMLLLAISLAVATHARRRPYLAVGWLWFIGMLVPVIGIVQVGSQALADRYTYLPLTGLFIMLAFGLRDLAEARPAWSRAIAGGAIMVLVALAARTTVEVSYWKSSETLASRAVELGSEWPIAHGYVGLRLARQGHDDEAEAHYAIALRGKPDYVEVHYNWGNLYLRRRQLDEAIVHLREAARLRPELVEAHNNLAAAYAMQGNFDAAIESYRTALELDGSLESARTGLAAATARRGAASQPHRSVATQPATN